MKLEISTLLLTLAATTSALPTTFRREFSPTYRAEVMGPLNRITDWGTFAHHLRQLKLNGVQALTTDIWWGEVEAAGDNIFNFTYYKTLAKTVRDAGLLWIPILSTHQCGGSGTTECNISLPKWYLQNLKDGDKYTSIFGTKSEEALTPWAVVNGKTAVQELQEFYEAFAKEFAEEFKGVVPRIDLSGGASGELRYPSYSLDNWKYPERGQLMAYNDAAIASFTNHTLTKYGSINAVNAAWGSSLPDASLIGPPCNTVSSSSVVPFCKSKASSDGFWRQGGWKSAYGNDYFEWYQRSILDFGVGMVQAAQTAFQKTFPTTTIAIKIAGVHWHYHDPIETRSAALATGYVNYDQIISAMKNLNAAITFTAIEQNDQPEAPFYSGAYTLAKEFYSRCQKLGAKCFAENALSIHESEVYKYKNMRNVLVEYGVEGITLLRYTDLVDEKFNALKLYTNYVSTVDPRTTVLRFQVGNIPTNLGEKLAVVGSIPQLGSWAAEKSLPMENFSCSGSACTWAGSVAIPGGAMNGKRVEWKVVKVDGTGKAVQWQCGGNNVVDVKSRVVNAEVNGSGSAAVDGDIATVVFGGVSMC